MGGLLPHSSHSDRQEDGGEQHLCLQVAVVGHGVRTPRRGTEQNRLVLAEEQEECKGQEWAPVEDDSAGGSIPDTYCATGSGSPYMYGVLEDGFSENMSRKDAVALAARALSASAQRDAASGNGMDLAVITAKDGYVPVDQSEIAAALKK